MFLSQYNRKAMSRTLLLILVMVVLGLANRVQAFPELARHGYTNCVACHISPTGGGVLTEYGRELSNEVLSAWGKEGEGRFLWGRVKAPAWLEMGGDIRGLYLKQRTPDQSRTVLMQADLEAALTIKRFSAVVTGGIQDSGVYPDNRFVSRRHYGLYRINDEISVRAGRFMQAYGINVADHAIYPKQGLGWDQGSESYNIEGSYLGEKYNLYVTGVFSRPDITANSEEYGGSASGGVFLSNKFKVGGSYFFGTNYAANRHVFGPWAILGFTPRLFLLSELDIQRSFARTAQDPAWGVVNYQRLNYEIFQGFHVFLTQQFSKLNFKKASSQREAYGIGIQFFPRPHFEILLNLEKRRNLATSDQFSDWVFAVLHFYP